MRIGLREANQRFSSLVKAVKAGEEVILTERGKPIAVITRVGRAAGGGQAVRRLAAAGLLRPATRPGPLVPRRPLAIGGPPLSETLRDERDLG
jgi:prevent-host-death family protein